MSVLAGPQPLQSATSPPVRFWLARLLAVALTLIAGGLVASFSATVFLGIARNDSPYKEFLQHGIFNALGIVLALVLISLGYALRPVRRWLQYLIPIAFCGSLVLVLLVKFSALGVSAYGATRSLTLGPLTFQPSETLKIALVLYLSQLLCWWRVVEPARLAPEVSARLATQRQRSLFSRIVRHARPRWPELPKRCAGLILVAAGATAIQPDLGSAIVIYCAGVLTVMLAGVSWKHLLGLVGVTAVLAGVLLLAIPDKYNYAKERITTWLEPMAADEQNEAAYQLTQSREALIAGGTWGRGYLMSEQKMNRLPFSTNDFIYPVMVEEFGAIGGVVIIGLFMALSFCGLRLALCLREPFNRTAVAALGFTICLQSIINIGVTIGTFPVSGLTLPFFSSGGTSLVTSIVAVGLMAALAVSELPRQRSTSSDKAVRAIAHSPAGSSN